MGRLEGKTAVITGGASGIGECAVRIFVREGAAVVIADMQDERGERLAEELGGNVIYQRTDVSVEADVAAVVDLSVTSFGRLDCMFNNAGFAGVSGELDQTVVGGEYERTVSVLFTGVFLGMKHAARVMKPSRSGSIISTASVAGVVGGFGPHVYSGLKAGVIGMTRSIANELAAFDIRVNAICPGGIATHIFAPMLESLDEGGNQDIPDLMRPRLAMLHPIKRSGEPEDIGELALYLASDESSFVTGQNIAVDGGLTTMRGEMQV